MRSTRRRRNTRTTRLIMGVLNMDMGVRVLLAACIRVMVVNRVVNMDRTIRTIRTIRTTMDIIKSITVTHGAEAEADTLTVIRC